jgi:mono/diheme cytochrome c family protein
MIQPAQQTKASMERDEPTAGDAGVPVWLVLLLFLLLYWGMNYVNDRGGWFNPEVFEPYKTFADVKTSQPYDPVGAKLALGEATFAKSCVLCHQANGMGKEGQFPPLAGSDWLLGAGPNRIGRIVLNGLSGPIRVEAASGVVSLNASMAPLGGTYTDEELAAALTYVRQQWGNKGPEVTADQIKAIRAAITGHPAPFTPDELLKIPVQ